MSVYLSIVKISLGGAAVVKAQLPVDQVQRYGASNLRVFGSVALNQEHQDSDLDLLVDLPANQSLLALVGIAQELEQLFRCLERIAEYTELGEEVNLNRVWRTVETDLPQVDTVALLGTFQQIRRSSGACSTAQSLVGSATQDQQGFRGADRPLARHPLPKALTALKSVGLKCS